MLCKISSYPCFIDKKDSEKDDLLISQNSVFFPLNCAAIDNPTFSSEEVVVPAELA